MGEEKDPNGTSPHEPGAKLDAGKNRLSLVLGGFSNALWEVGEVGTKGAEKYTDHGWREVPEGHSRYLDAAFRHLLKYLMGESEDFDSKQHHLAHAAWNTLAALQLIGEEDAVSRLKNEELSKEPSAQLLWVEALRKSLGGEQ